MNAPDYEWIYLVDGISQIENISFWHDTVTGTINDPSDKAELLEDPYPLAGNYQVTAADTSINGNQDYFLDFRYSYASYKSWTGLTDYSPIRLYLGTSKSTNNLTEHGADLLGASDLVTGFSDWVTPLMTTPTDGTVKFVSDIDGNGDEEEQCLWATLYLRVDDGDPNYSETTRQSLSVTLTTPGGDSETITVLETDVDTGIYTGSLPTSTDSKVAGDGTLQVALEGETVTVEYIDGVDGLDPPGMNGLRTDTILLQPPAVTVTKTVDPTETIPGGDVAYTVTVGSTGTCEARLTTIVDTLPAGFAYVPGSTTGTITTDNPAIAGQQLTWQKASDYWSIPGGGSVTLTFHATAAGVTGTYSNEVTASGTNFSSASSGSTAPLLVGQPLASITKSVDKETAVPGETVTYTIYYRNRGNGTAKNLVILDSVPSSTSYVAGSLREGDAASTYATANVLTDGPGESPPGNVDGQVSGLTISFIITSVAGDDGVPDSGSDEGKVYFTVTVQ